VRGRAGHSQHNRSPKDTCLSTLQHFAKLLEVRGAGPGATAFGSEAAGIDFSLGWYAPDPIHTVTIANRGNEAAYTPASSVSNLYPLTSAWAPITKSARIRRASASFCFLRRAT